MTMYRLMNQNNNLRAPNHFRGLSIDAKPTIDAYPIRNGDEFFEINTKKLFFYNSANEEWIEAKEPQSYTYIVDETDFDN